MKNSRGGRTIGVLLAVTLLGLGVAQQSGGFTTAYVDSDYLISLHSVYPEFVSLQEQARGELGRLNQQAQELIERNLSAAGLNSEEQEALNVALLTLESVGQRYDNEIRQLLEPALEEITSAIAEVARSLGISMVFDLYVAAESGLVVYADPESDITPLVAELMGRSN